MLAQHRASLGHVGSWVTADPNSEYMQTMREQHKTKLQSITGRMFQVRIIIVLPQYEHFLCHVMTLYIMI